MFVRKDMRVRAWHDDGLGGCYVYGVALSNGSRKPRIRWQSGIEQSVPVHLLEIVCIECGGHGQLAPQDDGTPTPCLACRGTGRFSVEREPPKSIAVGSHVRINPKLPGFGGALDRYGVVIAYDSGSLRCKIQFPPKPGPDQRCAAWIRLEDLTLVRGL